MSDNNNNNIVQFPGKKGKTLHTSNINVNKKGGRLKGEVLHDELPSKMNLFCCSKCECSEFQLVSNIPEDGKKIDIYTWCLDCDTVICLTSNGDLEDAPKA